MFSRNQGEAGGVKKQAETVIGASVKVEGNFNCEGNMIIDGQVKGNVETNAYLQVGNQAVITADVKAGDANIGGRIDGDVSVDGYLELTETAKINGNIRAAQLSVAKGAILNGHLSMSQEAPAEDAAPEEDESAAEEQAEKEPNTV